MARKSDNSLRTYPGWLDLKPVRGSADGKPV